MVSKKFLLKSNLKNIVEKYPFIEEFLKDNQVIMTGEAFSPKA